MNGNAKYFMWVIGGLVLIAIYVSSYSIARVDAVQNDLTANYVQKSDYRADIGRIDAGIQRLNEKMDRMLSDRE